MRCVRYRIAKSVRGYRRIKKHHKRRLMSLLDALRLYAGTPIGA